MAPKTMTAGAIGALLESGAVVEHAEALAFASAVQVPAAHSADASALNFKLRIALRASAHFERLPPLSTYCPSQKMAPFGSLHWTSQPPRTSASQLTASLPRQSISHFAEACAEQDPLQDPLHFALQSALGGVPLHFALHFALQLAEQCALQSACAWLPLASPLH